MGCWNKTCGLSNLQIVGGTPVYVFVLEHAVGHNPCHAMSLFKPLLVPFESEYNDYGGGENSFGPWFELIIEALRQRLVEREVGENRYHDIAVNRNDFDEESFFDSVREKRLMIDTSHGQTSIEFTMFRKDIADSVLDQYQIDEYVGRGNGTHGWDNAYIGYSFNDVVRGIRPLIEGWIQQQKMSNIKDTFVNFITMESIGRFETPASERSLDSLAAQWLGRETFEYSRIVDVRSHIRNLTVDPDVINIDELEGLLTEYLRGLFLDSFMHAARKTWIPGGHEGSQSDSRDALKVLCKVTMDAIIEEERDMEY